MSLYMFDSFSNTDSDIDLRSELIGHNNSNENHTQQIQRSARKDNRI